jgi:hypothetical protein
MAEGNVPRAEELTSNSGAVMLQDLPVGTKVRLRSDAVAEVTANPRDGGWIFVRYVESSKDPSKVGEDDMVFCSDVVAVVE